MRAKSLYLYQNTSTGYTVLKCDEFSNLVATYFLTMGRNGWLCSCPHGSNPRRKTDCRHVQMIEIFKKKKAFDKGKFYCYDDGTWTTA